MKYLKNGILILVTSVTCASAFGAGTGKMNVRTTNDTFNNSGAINASSNSSGGVSSTIAGQRVNAPSLALTFDYTSRGNRYNNSGSIKATSRSSSGASSTIAGQDVTF